MKKLLMKFLVFKADKFLYRHGCGYRTVAEKACWDLTNRDGGHEQLISNGGSFLNRLWLKEIRSRQ
jgi:hypothetical protein